MTLLALGCLTTPAFGQANFAEDFENIGPPSSSGSGPGPVNLIAQGWIFRNQSDPIGFEPAWYDGGIPSQAHQGSGYLTTDTCRGISIGNPNAMVSTWAILPPIPGQQAGDVLSFWAKNIWNAPFDVRYSPGGGTNTGTGPLDIGDFTDVLMNVGPAAAWLSQDVTLPGNGRLAFRFFMNAPFAACTPDVAVDTLRIESNPAPPCGVPIPVAGETVVWDLAGGPYQICDTLLIPVGGTVVVDPGVQIVDAGGTIWVDGTLTASGVSASQIQIAAPLVVLDGGIADLAQVSVTSVLSVWGGGSLLVADSLFPGGTISVPVQMQEFSPYIQVVGCTFSENGEITMEQGTLVVRDTTFQVAAQPAIGAARSLRMFDGYIYLDNVTFDGMNIFLWRNRSRQTVYINNVTVLNNTDRAGIETLGGRNFFFGPGNLFQNNLYPVSTENGIEPGSTLPLTGNINNAVWVLAMGPGDSPDVGIPYHAKAGIWVTANNHSVKPGANFFVEPPFGITVSQNLELLGLPGAPITFASLVPGQLWDGVAYSEGRLLPPHVEYCTFTDGDTALSISDADLDVDNCIFDNNTIGVEAGFFAIARIHKTQLLNNVIGAAELGGQLDMNGQTSPNAIVGNTTLGVGADTADARNNWWGDPSGPQHVSNPSGMGDAASNFVDVIPFRTTPPNFNDHPPVVRMIEPAFLAETGSKMLVTWGAFDDVAIVSQRVLFRTRFGNPFTVLADNLPPTQRSFEFVVPALVPTNLNGSATVRIEATDGAGQVGWDADSTELPIITGFNGDLVVTTDVSAPFVAGQMIDVCYNAINGASGTVDAWIQLGADEQLVSIGGAHTGLSCVNAGITRLPFVSTDTARIVLRYNFGTNHRRYYFSDYFTIRPDARMGDAPPSITMLTPSAGNSFAGGSIVPVTWTASDDEALRSFKIQASLDGGRIWATVVQDLPAAASSFNWRLPPSTGVPDTRVRVIAIDQRFQNSSDGGDRVFSITPGTPAVPSDINGDGVVDINDIPVFAAVLVGTDTDPNHVAASDLNGDGSADGLDVQPFVGALAGG